MSCHRCRWNTRTGPFKLSSRATWPDHWKNSRNGLMISYPPWRNRTRPMWRYRRSTPRDVRNGARCCSSSRVCSYWRRSASRWVWSLVEMRKKRPKRPMAVQTTWPSPTRTRYPTRYSMCPVVPPRRHPPRRRIVKTPTRRWPLVALHRGWKMSRPLSVPINGPLWNRHSTQNRHSPRHHYGWPISIHSLWNSKIPWKSAIGTHWRYSITPLMVHDGPMMWTGWPSLTPVIGMICGRRYREPHPSRWASYVTVPRSTASYCRPWAWRVAFHLKSLYCQVWLCLMSTVMI